MTYFNTTGLKGDALKEAEGKASTQEDTVLDFFKATKGTFTPDQVNKRCLSEAPLTSVRRAMCNLTTQGKLVKTEKKLQGSYGRDCHAWTLAGPRQLPMF